MHTIPETGFLRLPQIIGKPPTATDPGIPAIIPVSRSTWLAGVRSGRYPQPTRSLGVRITAWRAEDIRALIAAMAAEKAA
jgi:predicted DNA-binding transcriptional regulator AlpA